MIPTNAVPVVQTPNNLVAGNEVIVMSGIGNPKVFVASAKERYKVVGTLNFPDHHVYSVADINVINERLKQHPSAMLLTTEKDAVKLRRSRRVPENVRQRLFYQPVKIEFIDGSDNDFLGTLKNDLEGKVHLGDMSIGGENQD